jgi:hypothetical protein
MNRARWALAAVLLFVLSLLWNGFVHMVLLAEANAALAPLRRPDAEATMPLALLLTAGLAGVFVWGYARFARDRSFAEGALYGLFFALVAGLLVDLNQYVLYPIDGSLVAMWFAAGLAEFVVYGVILARLAPRIA